MQFKLRVSQIWICDLLVCLFVCLFSPYIFFHPQNIVNYIEWMGYKNDAWRRGNPAYMRSLNSKCILNILYVGCMYVNVVPLLLKFHDKNSIVFHCSIIMYTLPLFFLILKYIIIFMALQIKIKIKLRKKKFTCFYLFSTAIGFQK